MDLSPTFVSNIQAVYGDAGRTWLQRLPSHLEGLAKQWQFRFIAPIPNLTYGFVAKVEREMGKGIAILKTTPAGGSLIPELHWLQSFDRGVPKIYYFDEKKQAFLMECLAPGQPLKTRVQAGQDEAATRILCQIIRELQAEQKRAFPFKHLSELVKDLDVLRGQVDDSLLSKAESLFRDLTADRSQDVLLHGDLHHDNILSDGASWKAIDPHGYVGDPAAEVGAMIRNPMDCFPNDRPLRDVIESRLKILAEELPFDPQKIKDWTFCMTVLSVAWSFQDFREIRKAEIEIATVIDRINV